MKISEIRLSRDIKQAYSSEDVTKLLELYGWRFLGQGTEAAVAQHPTKTYVIKVFKTNSLFKDFYQTCQAHKNIHFPQFLSDIKIIPNTNRRWSYARMEKLQSIGNFALLNNYLGDIIYMLNQALESGISGGMGASMNDALEEYVYDKFGPKLWTFPKYQINPELLDIMPQSTYSWIDAADTVVYKAVKLKLEKLDLHSGNFMTRGSTLVILDPFYDTSFKISI